MSGRLCRVPSYVIVTESNREPKVVGLLTERGIPAYCPTSRKRHFTDRATTTRDAPLFPRYVFVASANVDRDFETIRHRTPHVVAFLGQNGRPKPVSEEWLGAILMIDVLGGFDYTRDRRPKLRLGQSVRIVAGKFGAMDYLGVVTAFRSGRVVVDVARSGPTQPCSGTRRRTVGRRPGWC